MRSVRGLFLVKALLLFAASTSAFKVENKDVASTSRSVESERSLVNPENYVLVIDASESVKRKDRFSRIKRIGIDIIQNHLPNNAKVGIASFNYVGWQNTNSLVGDINNLVDIINGLVARGTSDIARGIYKGIDLLNGPNNQDRGGVMILITDGEQSPRRDNPDGQVLYQIQKQGLKLIVVDVNSRPSDKLKSLAVKTDGNYYFIRDTSKIGDYDFTKNSTFQSNVKQDQAEFVLKRYVEPQDSYVVFNIDEKIGKDVEVILSTFVVNLEPFSSVRITFPDGSVDEKVIDNTDTKFSYDSLAVGQYIVEVTYKGGDGQSTLATIKVISKQRDDQTLPFNTFYTTSGSYVKRDGQLHYSGSVEAEVWYGDYAVNKATVECSYDDDIGDPKTLTLSKDYDDGSYEKNIKEPVGEDGFSLLCQVKDDDGTSLFN